MRAFVLRMNPPGGDVVESGRSGNWISIGWGRATGLLDPGMDRRRFRSIVRDTYHAHEPDWKRAGVATGQLWRFIREMAPGDLVVVPHGGELVVAEVTGAPWREDDPAVEHSAHRRSVRWLGAPVPRSAASRAVRTRTGRLMTLVDASDLVDEIRAMVASHPTPAPR